MKSPYRAEGEAKPNRRFRFAKQNESRRAGELWRQEVHQAGFVSLVTTIGKGFREGFE